MTAMRQSGRRMWMTAACGAFVVAPLFAQEPATGMRPASATTHAGAAPASSAQPEQPVHTGPRTLVRDTLADFEHLPAPVNLEPLAIGSVLTLAVHPADSAVHGGVAGDGVVHDVLLPANAIGYWPAEVGAAVGAYLIGQHTRNGKVAHVAMDVLRAELVSGAVTEAIKVAVRRERPDGSGRDSFPSGHASTAFASATVLARHLGWRWAVPAYLVASYVAASRVEENRHYLSDVVFGSTVGFIAGRTVTRHGRSDFAVVPVAVPGGMAVVVARLPRGSRP
jgi:hypothetical protein